MAAVMNFVRKMHGGFHGRDNYTDNAQAIDKMTDPNLKRVARVLNSASGISSFEFDAFQATLNKMSNIPKHLQLNDTKRYFTKTVCAVPRGMPVVEYKVKQVAADRAIRSLRALDLVQVERAERAAHEAQERKDAEFATPTEVGGHKGAWGRVPLSQEVTDAIRLSQVTTVEEAIEAEQENGNAAYLGGLNDATLRELEASAAEAMLNQGLGAMFAGTFNDSGSSTSSVTTVDSSATEVFDAL